MAAAEEQTEALAEEAPTATADETASAVHLPDPSIWPLVIAVGLAVLMSGIVLHLLVLLAGLAILVFGIGGWIYQDIQVARRSEEH